MHARNPLVPLLILAAGSASALSIPEHVQRPIDRPTVKLHSDSNVIFHGSARGSVESFLNIRFGHDTSGNNRFAPPEPYLYPANSVHNASLTGAACPQQKVPIPDLPLFDNVTNVSEDCLTLRVDRPAGTSRDAGLPVMVYIYGGGDTIGQIYDNAYDPSAFVARAAEDDSPIIYAAMNYRLGIFGFAASSALEAADSLNVGLLDQLLALEWIRKNIAAFGGDPNRVTIFGESDGATGVGLQITAYGGTGVAPFQRAIMQSGGPTADSGTASNISANHTSVIVQRTNCTADTSEEELSCLRNLPLEALLNTTIAYELSIAQWGIDVFIPTAPSTFIPDSPSQLLRSGRFSRNIDIISGWNENDGSLFVPTTLQSEADVVAFLFQSYPVIRNDSVQEALALYPSADFQPDVKENVSSQYFRTARMLRDATDVCPSILLVTANRDHNECNSSTSNYLFALNQTVFSTFYDISNTSYYGVSHFSDIPYVFDQISTKYAEIASPADKELATAITGSWTGFAARGDVESGDDGLLGWNSDEDEISVRVIGGPDAGPRALRDYEDVVRRCEFWNSPRMTKELQV